MRRHITVGIGATRAFVLHAQREGGDARAPRLRPGDQPRQQQAGAVQDLVAGVGAREQLEPTLEMLGHRQRLARVGRVAAGAVQLMQQRFAETPCQPGARQRAQVGQPVQAHALQGFPMFAARAEQPHRRGVEQRAQGGEPGGVRTGFQIAVGGPAPARQQRRAGGGGCGGGLQAVAQRRQRIVQLGAQAGRTAVVAQHHAQFQQHGGRAGVEHHHRREGQRRVRHRLQRGGVARAIGLPQAQRRRQRQGSGTLEARAHAGFGGRRVDGGDAVLRHQGQRRGTFGRIQRGGKGLQRQLRQVQGEPVHGVIR